MHHADFSSVKQTAILQGKIVGLYLGMVVSKEECLQREVLRM